MLLSGDEDTRIGVQIAQSFGVRVHLLGIRGQHWNQSRSLKRESDTTTEWSREEVGRFLTLAPTSEMDPDVRGEGYSASGINQSDREILEEGVMYCLQSCAPAELAELGPGYLVPPPLDSKLLRTCTTKLKRALDEPEKHLVRKLLKERAASMISRSGSR